MRTVLILHPFDTDEHKSESGNIITNLEVRNDDVKRKLDGLKKDLVFDEVKCTNG